MDIFEQIHAAGYVFNDLKLDNLLFDVGIDKEYLMTTDDNIFEKHAVHIIDFGFATRYLHRGSREHLSKKLLDVFRGNIEFSSLNQMRF